MILHEILPIDVSINLEDAVFIPYRAAAIPLNVDVTIPSGPHQHPDHHRAGLGTPPPPRRIPFSGLAVPGLGVGLLGLFDRASPTALISGQFRGRDRRR